MLVPASDMIGTGEYDFLDTCFLCELKEAHIGTDVGKLESVLFNIIRGNVS